MKKLMLSILLALSTVAAQASTNVALTIDYGTYSITFPTNAAGITQFCLTNDIARLSAMNAYSNALNAYSTNLYAQMNSYSSALHAVDVGITNQIAGISNALNTADTNLLAQLNAYSNALNVVDTNLQAQIDSGAGFTNPWSVLYSDGSTNSINLGLGPINSYLRSSGIGSAPAWSALTAIATNASLANLIDIVTNGWMVVGDGSNLVQRSQAFCRTNLSLVPGIDIMAYNTNLQIYTTNAIIQLLAVDGAGSGLDADMVDGYSSAELLGYVTNLFAGIGTTGMVSAATADTDKFLHSSGAWKGMDAFTTNQLWLSPNGSDTNTGLSPWYPISSWTNAIAKLNAVDGKWVLNMAPAGYAVPSGAFYLNGVDVLINGNGSLLDQVYGQAIFVTNNATTVTVHNLNIVTTNNSCIRNDASGAKVYLFSGSASATGWQPLQGYINVSPDFVASSYNGANVSLMPTYTNIFSLGSTSGYVPMSAGSGSGFVWTNLSTIYLPLAGGTLTDVVKSTVDYTTSSPANDDIALAGWVRSLAMSGQEWWFTTTVSNFGGIATTNFVALDTTIPTDAFTNSIPSPVASDTYLVGGIATQLFGELRSPITFEMYLNRVGGNASSIIPVHPEIYYVYQGTTNALGDWETANQNVTATTPTRYTFTVAFADPMVTGAVHVLAYLKSGTVSGTSAGLNIVGGNGYASHMNIDGVSEADVEKVYNMANMTNWNGSVVDGDLNMGGNSVTNALSYSFGNTSGATNMTFKPVAYTLNSTNYYGIEYTVYTNASNIATTRYPIVTLP